MDTLETLIYAQEQVELNLGGPMGKNEAAIKECMLALIVEATEVLNEINWKPWKQPVKQVNEDDLRGELADCFLFWALAVNSAGINPTDMLTEIKNKQEIAVIRHRSKYQ